MAEREGFEPSRQGFAPSTRFPGERLRPAQPSLHAGLDNLDLTHYTLFLPRVQGDREASGPGGQALKEKEDRNNENTAASPGTERRRDQELLIVPLLFMVSGPGPAFPATRFLMKSGI